MSYADLVKLGVRFYLQGEAMRLLKPGVYEGTIENVEMRRSAKGNSYVSVEIQLDNGEKVFDQFSLLPKALWFFRKLFLAVGITSDEPEIEDLIGKRVQAKIDQREWDGRVFNDVIAYFSGLSAEQISVVNTLSPLEVLKLVYPDKDVESLMRVLNSQVGA